MDTWTSDVGVVCRVAYLVILDHEASVDGLELKVPGELCVEADGLVRVVKANRVGFTAFFQRCLTTRWVFVRPWYAGGF